MCSYPTRNRKFKKNSKKIQKIRKYHYRFFFCQNRLGKAEKEKLKKIVTMCCYPTRNRRFQKKRKKFKKLENTIIASFQTKIGWERPKKRENKKNRSDVFLPNP